MTVPRFPAVAGLLKHIDEIVYHVEVTPGQLHGGRALFVGGRVEATLGYRPEEFFAEPDGATLWFRLLHPEDIARLNADTRRLVEERVPVVRTYRMLSRLTGAYRWLEDRALPQLDSRGAVIGLFGVARDITDRRRAEEEVRRLGSALQHIGDAVLITANDGAIEYVNSSFEVMTGWTLEEVRGRQPSLLKSGRHEPAFYRELWETVRTGVAFRGEFYNRRRNGEIYLEEKTIAPVFDAAGTITHFVSVGRDITVRRALDQQRSTHQRLEALGRLAGSVAHDFNNFITVISGCAYELDRHLGERPDLRELVGQIAATSERAAMVTGQLLAFSRREVSTPRVLRPGSLLEGLRAALVRLAGPGAELSLVGSATPECIRIDATQFEQVVINLVVNAQQALDERGHITVELDAIEACALSGRWTPPEGVSRLVRLRVSDDGCGMEAETQQRIFEPFFTTRPDAGGTGLGLATVQAIVANNGGGIDVESRPEQGTTFTLYFPIVFEQPSVPFRSISTTRGGTEHILLVEDDELVNRIVQRTLTSHGYEVVAVREAREALRAAGRSGSCPFDLVVSDLLMPGTTGDQLIAQLRELRPELPALLITGCLGDPNRRPTNLSADLEVLPKPFTSEQLLGRVRAILDGVSASRA